MRRIEADTLAELFQGSARHFGDRPAFAYPVGKSEFKEVTFRELYDLGLCLGTALIDLGLQARDHVAILSDNRIEWIITDYAVILSGAADVPRALDIPRAEVRYILSHSDATMVFVENRQMLDVVLANRSAYPNVKQVVLMERSEEAPAGVHHIQALIEQGRKLREAGDRRVEERMGEIRTDDCFTLIYTSGTTGLPKGVELTHANMMSQLRNVPVFLTPEDRALSILPVWHSYERVFEMVMIAFGGVQYYTSIRRIAEDLQAVKPTVMASAPRLWENLYQRIQHRVYTAPPLRRALFSVAMWTARNHQGSRYFLKGQEIDLAGKGRPPLRIVGESLRFVATWLPYRLMDKLVFAKLRDVIGGRLRATISGGGALPQHVDEFYNYIGIPVLEGYGMTETSPVIAVRTGEVKVIGTVGFPLPETEVRIFNLNDGSLIFPNPDKPGEGRGIAGELHVRGPQVMRGYYKNKVATSEVLRDGWMNTGDIAVMTYNDCLKIVGRSKETIVLLNGENIQPTPIESKLVESSLISQCIVVGQDERHLGALLVVDEEPFKSEGIQFENPSDLNRNHRAVEAINRDIQALVSRENGFRHYELIHTWRVIDKAFEVGDELTNTFKVKRHVVAEKYKELVDELFHHSRTKAGQSKTDKKQEKERRKRDKEDDKPADSSNGKGEDTKAKAADSSAKRK